MCILRKSLSLKLSLWIALSSSFFSSCGYHPDGEEVSYQFPTLSIPYFKGDSKGLLTEAVIRSVASLSSYRYANQGGTYFLEGEIVSDSSEHIGYQYDRHPISGERIHRLIPNEGRRIVTAKITVIDSRTLKTVYGPFHVTAESDYDFVDSDSLQDASFINSSGSRESVLLYSLGQLDSVDGAKASALDPVYKCLAYKIAEGLSHLPYRVESDK